MTIAIDISPDVESRLEGKAASSGLAVPDYVRKVVEDGVAARLGGGQLASCDVTRGYDKKCRDEPTFVT